jgi:DNA-binding NarL/FixJ family response regulator
LPDASAHCVLWALVFDSKSSMALKILVGDDHTLVRQALRKILESVEGWVVVEARDGREAVQLTLDQQPDIAILDIAMPHMDGLEAVAEIRQHAPGVRVLMLSMYSDDGFVRRAFAAGANGYLLKAAADTDLIAAVSAVAAGHSFVSPAAASVLRDVYLRRTRSRKPRDRFDSLSEREREVFQLVAEGRTNRDIAKLLEITPATVETHRARILQKLNIHNTAELVLCAARQRVIA